MPTKHKISIVTLGCAKNTSDTDNLSRQLRAHGHEVVADAAQADAIVVHTCSFIEAAKKESIEAILQAGQLKAPGKKLIVSGCLVQQHGQELWDEMPEVDAFLGTGQLAQIAELLDKPKARFMDRAKPGGFMDPDLDEAMQDPTGVVGASAYLRLSEGCRHPCSFCVIPRLRGSVQSRTPEAILKEVRHRVAQGVEEFSIIGQDTGDWGYEWRSGGKVLRVEGREKRPPLAELLREIGKTQGVRWVRLMYMHPASFTSDLLDVLSENPDRFPYLDMPLQHIDSTVLADMKRKTDEVGIRQLLERIKQRAPHLTLRTTFIVGYPGETEEQFIRLLNFVKEGHFDYLGAFAYSQEEATPAAAKKEQIPDDVKQDRLRALTEAYYDVAHAKAQRRLNTVETVVLEESDEAGVLARSRCEAPGIDAVIRLPRSAARRGRFVQARLTAYDAYEYAGQPA